MHEQIALPTDVLVIRFVYVFVALQSHLARHVTTPTTRHRLSTHFRMSNAQQIVDIRRQNQSSIGGCLLPTHIHQPTYVPVVLDPIRVRCQQNLKSPLEDLLLVARAQQSRPTLFHR
jgi:hypothetical protein